MLTDENTSWTLAEIDTNVDHGPGREESDFEQLKELRLKIAEIADAEGWSKAETARRTDLGVGSFSQWLSGKYKGRIDNINQKVIHWLQSYEETASLAAQMPVSPGFIKTKISNEIIDALTSAHVMPGMVMINCDAGLGKTMTAKHYHAVRPNTFMATISPHTKTVHGCLMEISDAVGVNVKNPATVVRAIGERVKRRGAGTLLIIDEAQNLVDDAINQLRHFLDNWDCGIALMGNSETYARFSTSWSQGPKYGQLRRRIFKRIHTTRPTTKDLQAFIKAWGVKEQEQIDFLVGVGKKPGAFGQIDMTVKLAKIHAIGGGRDLSLGDLKWAWENRDVEGL